MPDALSPYLHHGFYRKTAEHLTQAYLAAYLAVLADVPTAIGYMLAQQALLTVLRTVGLPLLWRAMSAIGLRGSAVSGLLTTTVAMLMLPFSAGTYWLLGIAAALHATGSALYYGALHAGLFAAVGRGERPGRSTALVALSTTAGFVVASASVFSFTLAGIPDLIPLPAGGALLISCLHLRHLDLDAHEVGSWPGWSAITGAVSSGCLIANFNPDHRWLTAAVPLAAAASGDLTSFATAAGITIGSIVGLWFGGASYDRGSATPAWIGFGVMVLCVSVIVVGPVSMYGVAITAYTIAGHPVGVARDSRTAAETAAVAPVLAVAAFEAMRAAGGAFGCAVLALCYWTAGTVPAWLPAVGLLIYALGPFRYALQAWPNTTTSAPTGA
ncbi:hypothetical protein [Azospirillum argentinense]